MDIYPFRQDKASICMGLDEAILNARIRGDIDDTLRFFQFKPSTVSIGYFQSTKNQVNLEKCKERKIDLVRRMTGGGTVFHDTGGEITYSITLGLDNRSKDIVGSYKLICSGIVEALKELGVESEFRPVNDVLVGERKISGSAQTRKKGVLLQHGTFMYDTDIETLAQVLKVSNEKLSDKFVKSVRKRVTTVRIECEQASYEDTLDAMTKGFSNIFGELHASTPSNSLMEEAKALAQNKYDSQEHLFLR